jgi:hypothetical protein
MNHLSSLQYVCPSCHTWEKLTEREKWAKTKLMSLSWTWNDVTVWVLRFYEIKEWFSIVMPLLLHCCVKLCFTLSWMRARKCFSVLSSSVNYLYCTHGAQAWNTFILSACLPITNTKFTATRLLQFSCAYNRSVGCEIQKEMKIGT